MVHSRYRSPPGLSVTRLLSGVSSPFKVSSRTLFGSVGVNVGVRFKRRRTSFDICLLRGEFESLRLRQFPENQRTGAIKCDRKNSQNSAENLPNLSRSRSLPNASDR
jgi:hypothetical protein